MKIEGSFSIDNRFVGRLYTCNVKSPPITYRGTKVTSCKGVHQAGKTYADVEAIVFNSLVVEYFPMGLHEIFPNLKEIEVFNCGLKEISRQELIGLESLSGLMFGRNRLKSLPDNLLSGMRQLTHVSFYNNTLEFVSSKLLQPIKNNKLIYVAFHDNPTIIGFYVPGNASSLGSLQELCDVIDKNCKKPVVTRQDQVAKDFPESIVKGFKDLWTSGRLSDFVIVCGLKEFKVHKTVLAIQSPVLEAAFQNDMQESKTGRMEIKDFSQEAVEDFLQYMYTGETPKETNAMEILALASMYDVPELQNLMEEIVQQNIDETNALEILTLAKQHNFEFLTQAAFSKIQLNFPKTKLDRSLVENPEKLKQLIDAKREHERVQIDAKRECERILSDSERKYEKVLKSCSQIRNQHY